MEDEIDLRAYVEVLLQYWYWIAGLAVLAASVAFVFASLRPPMYEAKSVVIITQPRYQMQFDPRFETANGWRPAAQVFPTLAVSDEVLQHVVDRYTPSREAEIDTWSLAGLSGMVDASSEGDPSLVVLKVTARSATDAAGIANAWAAALVEQAARLYHDTEEDVAFFEAQVAEAKQKLEQAEADLIALGARDQAGTINARLSSLRQAQTDYLADQRSILSITRDIRSLREQLAEQTGSEEASLRNSLTALSLQIKAYNAQASIPLQIQVDSPDMIADETTAEQIAILDGLAARLESKSAEIDERLAELEPEALDLQQQLQMAETEKAGLTRARDLAHETYITLSRKLDEARIAAQEEEGLLAIGSCAAVPEWPVASRRLFTTVIGGMLGLMVGVVGAFSVNFLRQSGGEAPLEG